MVRTYDLHEDGRIDYVISNLYILVLSVYKADGFLVAVRLFSNTSQITVVRAKTSLLHEPLG